MTTDPKSAGAAIQIDQISKYYGSFVALDDVSLDIRQGEFMSFLGPSGSGKTTTLNVIAGFTENDRGSIRLDGQPIDKLPPHKRNIGVVFQHYALFPHMTVAANVAYPLRQRGVPKAERQRRVAETLAKVALDPFASRYPAELSGGQQQRVALARAMVFNPGLLLMDEPLGALDKKLREVLQLEIKRIHRELGSTFVYVTHDQEEALVLSDRIAVFNKGRVQQVGTGIELYTKPQTLFVGQFIGESAVLRGEVTQTGDATGLRIGDRLIGARGRPQDSGPQAILVRPEHISVHRPGTAATTPQTNALRGRSREAIYLGAAVKDEVLLPDDTVIIARSQTEDRGFALGDAVDLHWHERHSVLLADDAAN